MRFKCKSQPIKRYLTRSFYYVDTQMPTTCSLQDAKVVANKRDDVGNNALFVMFYLFDYNFNHTLLYHTHVICLYPSKIQTTELVNKY